MTSCRCTHKHKHKNNQHINHRCRDNKHIRRYKGKNKYRDKYNRCMWNTHQKKILILLVSRANTHIQNNN